MKVGVYGDSFGAGFAHKIPNGFLPKLSHIGKSWVEILSEDYHVSNYCEFSASLVHSVNQFVKTNHNYDSVLFLVTSPGRITMGHPSKNQPLPHFISYDSAKLWTERATKEGWLEQLDSVLNYYFYIYDKEHVNLIHQSLVDRIKKIRPDTIIIPNFLDSFEGITGNTLVDIFDLENRHWNISYPIFEYDMRKCHMTKENNEVLACYAKRWIQGETVNIDISDFKRPISSKDMYIFKNLT